ncbi:variable surface protein [Plasmodium gonderi]|uniref:Variable surface protein n=1 Tax=Plasmodium gonderi TaxID=77519 RepID=A0A1Y1JH45_PLAGO|nr:variable surface protein [Plasmodium gonderi]GAW80082.1 variable surface protein [Plasmodium gonderi]
MEEIIGVISPHLKESPSYTFYQKLINEKDVNNVSHFCNSALNKYKDSNWVYKLCGNLIKNLELLRDDKDDIFRKKHCFDVNYWLYDHVHKNLNDTKKEKDFNNIINFFEETWKYYVVYSITENVDKEICYPYRSLFRENFLNHLNVVKNFLDYVENFNFIKTDIGKSTYYACQKYFHYLKERIPLYFSFKPLCTKLESNVCTDHIKYHHLYNPKNLFTNGELVKIYLESWCNSCYKNALDLYYESQKPSSEYITKYNEYLEPLINKRSNSSVNLAKRDTTQLPIVNVPVTSGKEQPTRVKNPLETTEAPITGGIETPRENISKLYGDNIFYSSLTNEQSFSINKFVLFMIFILFGIIMLLFVFYKIKSFGKPFTRRRKKIKSYLLDDYNTEDKDSIFDNSDSFSSISKSSTSSMAYNPT